jgi:hypothetical protein
MLTLEVTLWSYQHKLKLEIRYFPVDSNLTGLRSSYIPDIIINMTTVIFLQVNNGITGMCHRQYIHEMI